MQFVIHNQELTVTVDTKGAEVVSVKNKAGEETIWCGDSAVWGRHAPILFPWTGKLTGGVLIKDGVSYAGGQHGFARDLEHTLVEQQADKLVLCLASDEETRKRFPYEFKLYSEFVLEGKTLHHTLRVVNPGQEELRFGIGYHPAFAIPFDDKHTTTDYEFRFDKKESPLVVSALPHGLLNGQNYYLGTNIDTVPLTDDLFAHDSFCMVNLASSTLGIVEKDTGRNITCNIAGYPYTLIWSALSEKIHFVCIEPWRSLTGPETGSSEWNDRPAAAILAPGEQYATTLSTTFDR